MYAEAPFSRAHLDRVGEEALLDRVVDLRKTHHRHVHTTLRHGSPGDFRRFTRIRVVGDRNGLSVAG